MNSLARVSCQGRIGFPSLDFKTEDTTLVLSLRTAGYPGFLQGDSVLLSRIKCNYQISDTLHPASAVLFNFPSRYYCAIGLR